MSRFICLSSAPNLRCEDLSRHQAEILIVPPALEVVFAVSLVVAKWGSGSRKHFLLAAEGLVYFSLAFVDLLSHIVPSARTSLKVFRTLDILIASTSFIPLLLYTLFLFLFTSGKLIQSLPQRYQRITKYLIIIFIPAIVALNEISSFIGISHRIILRSTLIIGFHSQEAQSLWTFFSSITLALLTIYQAINFVLTFYQLIRVFIDQQRIEVSQSDEAHLFQGIGWIAAGIKLGAIESVIGFAPSGFGGAITRRVLRLLGRACLSIGVVKGLDTAEDFRNLDQELRGNRFFRGSKIKPLISNPRSSTFRHLSPSETVFHERPHAPHLSPDRGISEKSPSIATFDMRTPAPWSPVAVSPAAQSPGEYQSASYRTPRNELSAAYPTSNYAPSFGFLSPNATPTQTPRLRPQRVTVLHEQGQAPTLQMRFSTLDMPSPSALESTKFHYPSGTSGFLSTSDYPTVYLQSPPKAVPRSGLPRSRSTFEIGSTERHNYNRSNSVIPRTRTMSSDSLASDSLEAVRNLAAQFPGLPPRVTWKSRGSILGEYYSEDPVKGLSRETSTKTYRTERSVSSMVPGLSHSNSLVKRKPAPPLPQLDIGADVASNAASQNYSVRAEAGHEVSHYFPGDDTTASSPSTQVSSFGFQSRRESSIGTPATENHGPFAYDEVAPSSSKSHTFASSEYDVGSRASIHSAEWLATAARGKRVMAVDVEAYRKGTGRAIEAMSQTTSEAPSTQDSFGEKLVPTDTLPAPWVARDVKDQREDDLAQVKTLGSAPRKRTPMPNRVGSTAVSMAVDRMEVEAWIEKVPRQESEYAI